jgi:hypothetical protein
VRKQQIPYAAAAKHAAAEQQPHDLLLVSAPPSEPTSAPRNNVSTATASSSCSALVLRRPGQPRPANGKGEALIYTALLLVCGMADNVLRPLMLGRGMNVPDGHHPRWRAR